MTTHETTLTEEQQLELESGRIVNRKSRFVTIVDGRMKFIKTADVYPFWEGDKLVEEWMNQLQKVE